MDENSYKSPETKGKPGRGDWRWFRIVAQIVVAACGSPFALLAMVLVTIEVMTAATELMFYALISAAIAALFFFVATRIPS